MDWASYYPAFAEPRDDSLQSTENTNVGSTETPRKLKQDVEVADIGCGFGGLLVALAPKLPDTLLLGTYYIYG